MAANSTAFERGLENKGQIQADKQSAVSKSRFSASDTPAPSTLAQVNRSNLTVRLNQLLIRLELPMRGELDAQRKADLVGKTFDVVTYIFQNTQPGITLVNELPNFNYIRTIVVEFGDDFAENRNETDARTLGNFDPAQPSSEYKLNLIYQYGTELYLSEEERARGEVLLPSPDTQQTLQIQKWPNASCGYNIPYQHKKAESQMAIAFLHELLHVWFVNKYWKIMPGLTGHGDVMKCKFDVINQEPVFFNRLAEFYKEIDKKEMRPAP